LGLLPNNSISKVKLGQKVQMRVSACPYPDYGTLKGVVQTVAPDALPVASNGVAPAVSPSVYEVTIQPENKFVGRGDRICRLQAGMEGRADIISRSETVVQFILRKARLIADL
jgi:HlyD family secretion protein